MQPTQNLKLNQFKMSPSETSSTTHFSETHCNVWHPFQFSWPSVANEHRCACVSTTLQVEQGWSQLLSLCQPSIAPSGLPFSMKRSRKCNPGAICPCARQSEGLGGAALEDGVLHNVGLISYHRVLNLHSISFAIASLINFGSSTYLWTMNNITSNISDRF